MVLLETLLPVLLEGEHVHKDTLLGVQPLIDELADHGITSDADLLFASASAKLSIEAVRTLEVLQVRDKIAHFLAAEASPADELYSQAKATATQPTTPAEGKQDLCSTGVEAVDKLLDGGWSGEVVELLGEAGTGKTWLALRTVLNRLYEHPSEQALWLDTTASFSAERGSQILQSIITSSPETMASTSCHSGQPTAPTEQPSNALDRLIVAKVFDLHAAIQAIQQVRSHAPAKEEDEAKREESKVPTDLPVSEANMAVDSDATIYSNEVPETGRPAIELLQSSADPSAQVKTADDLEEEGEKLATSKNESKPISTQPHLRFIVIDSISALLKGVLNATSAEGHARMLSFMRLLRSITTTCTSSTTSDRKTTIFVINNLVSLASTANSTDALHSVFPALNAKRYKAALGPTFTYLTDWTIYLSNVRDVFPQYGLGEEMEGDETRKRVIFEVVRSRRMGRWAIL